MTKDVVHILEPVKIDGNDCQLLRLGGRRLELIGKEFVEGRAVLQSRESVVLREILDPRLRPPLFGRIFVVATQPPPGIGVLRA